MQAKLHINLQQGIVDVEGDLTLVKEVYQDFKDRVLSDRLATSQPQSASAPAAAEETGKPGAVEPPIRAKAKRASKSRSRGNGAKSSTEKPASYNPTMDKTLDTGGLEEHLSKYEPKNHPETILVFAEFLEEKGIEPCAADQIYTCYRVAKKEIPKAFLQAIRDAHSKKYGFIEYTSTEDIKISNIGRNHLKKITAKN